MLHSLFMRWEYQKIKIWDCKQFFNCHLIDDHLRVQVDQISHCQLKETQCILFLPNHYLINLFFKFCSKFNLNLEFLLFVKYFSYSFYFFVDSKICFLNFCFLFFCHDKPIELLVSLLHLKSMNNHYLQFDFSE